MYLLSEMKKKRLTPTRVVRGIYHRLRVYAEGICSIPIKLWYANNSGFRYNFGEKRKLKRLQNDFSLQNSSILVKPSDLSVEFLQQNGFLTRPTCFEKPFLCHIKEIVAQKINDSAISFSSPNGATRFLLDPLENIPELALFLSKELCTIITAYYQCAFRVESVRVWRNYHVSNINNEKDDKFSNTFHHDNCPALGLRVFVLLNDAVTRETGALRFHDKNTSKSIIRKLQYFHREKLTKSMRQRLVNPSTLKFFEGDLGDVCICNTQECLHAASVPKFGAFRDMLQFEIYPTTGPILPVEEILKNLPLDKGLLAQKN